MTSVGRAPEGRSYHGREAVHATGIREQQTFDNRSTVEDEEEEEEGESDDEQELLLRRRLEKSEELIRQLKLIVKAQHAKIEELRNQLPETRGDIVRGHIYASETKDIALLSNECEELRRKAGVFRADAVKYKKDNETLKKANRRLEAMLHEIPGSKPTSPRLQPLALMNSSQGPGDEWWSPATLPRLTDAVISPGGPASEQVLPSDTPSSVASASKRVSGQDRLLTLRVSTVIAEPAAGDEPYWSPSESPPDSPSAHVERLKKGANQKGDGNMPKFSRLAKLHSIMPNFWRRRLENPVAVLRGLADVAARALTDGLVTVSVYIIDPWLRQHLLSKADGGEGAVYYLGQSKTELHALVQPGTKPEPPRFADFHELPMQTRTALAVVLQMPGSHRRLAVLQATPHPTAAKLAGPSASRPWRGRGFVTMAEPSDDQCQPSVKVPSSAKGSSRGGGNVITDNLAHGFTDSHFMCEKMEMSR